MKASPNFTIQTVRRLCGGAGIFAVFLSIAAFQNCQQISYVPPKKTSDSTSSSSAPATGGAPVPSIQLPTGLAPGSLSPAGSQVSSAPHQIRYLPGTFNLTTDQSVALANATLSFHGDGNLLMFDPNINPVWDAKASLGTGACSGGVCTATFQADGNFVLYKNGTPYLATSTNPRGASLLLSDTAPYVQILDAAGAVLWSSDQAVPPLPAPSPGPASTQLPTAWLSCANEATTCSFSGTHVVRYGANGTYFYLTETSSVFCDNSVFGDPTPGVYKQCDVAQ